MAKMAAIEVHAKQAGMSVREYLIFTIETSSSLSDAAKKLKVSRVTLYKYMGQFGLGHKVKVEVIQ